MGDFFVLAFLPEQSCHAVILCTFPLRSELYTFPSAHSRARYALMRIKEVEELLNIDRETVRFYIRQGLLSPKQQANRYRDYSDEDIRQLKRIIIMRDLDMSIEDIRGAFNSESDFNEVLEKSRESLDRKRASLANTERILADLARSGVPAFDPDKYGFSASGGMR